ncbi:Gpi1-domain-containing protein [Fomitopsis betulina]|nr:Gpi1-domain-containing protein [Fomitopsis betulina]
MFVFWPIDVKKDGFCYGWEEPLPCVAGVLLVDSYEAAQRLLSDISTTQAWRELRMEVGVDFPTVLGRCCVAPRSAEPGIKWHTQTSDPDGVSHTRVGRMRQEYILYKRPNRSSMQFYSFDSRMLDILPSQTTKEPSSRRVPADLSMRHDFTRPPKRSCPTLDGAVLKHINASRAVSEFIDEALRIPRRDFRLGPVSHADALAESSTVRSTQMQTAGNALRSVLSPFRDLSTTVEQLDVRCEQAFFLISHGPSIVGRHMPRPIDSISQYVKFYNCVWLVLNDIIIGVAFGSFLCENCHVLGNLLDSLTQYYLVESMQRALLWLNSWPAGLKLNTELSQFYCHSLLAAITIWGRVLQNTSPYYPALFWIVGASGSCGMTMVVSLLSDIISIFTLHLRVCYILSATAFRHELGLAGSLWNLFRGKRLNVLRNRLDSWDYDIDQLLLGTILFTLVAFLYPTVLTYYALFASMHLAIIVVHGLLDTVSALLNHFPLFALMLRIKDPMRLPGHVVFKRLSSGSLLLQNESAPLSSIFAHYGDYITLCLLSQLNRRMFVQDNC